MRHTEKALDDIWHSDDLHSDEETIALMSATRILARHIAQLFAQLEAGWVPDTPVPEELVRHAAACAIAKTTGAAIQASAIEAKLRKHWESLFLAVQHDRVDSWQARQMYLRLGRVDSSSGIDITGTLDRSSATLPRINLFNQATLDDLIRRAIARRWTAADMARALDDLYDASRVHAQARLLHPPGGIHFDSILAAFYDWLKSEPYGPEAFNDDWLLGYSMARGHTPKYYYRFMHDENRLCNRQRLDASALLSPPGCIWQLRGENWRKEHSATPL
ncbi:hypothetical protein [Noviherbaspirillum malthae]|uniref:hypothetical protein n=1 Tax=Noviherbaspirillum malthae TaxID=1260987 RepID=UPI00188E431E|nr:hypothetical protein [Noviherbaspirillum malthae]